MQVCNTILFLIGLYLPGLFLISFSIHVSNMNSIFQELISKMIHLVSGAGIQTHDFP